MLLSFPTQTVPCFSLSLTIIVLSLFYFILHHPQLCPHQDLLYSWHHPFFHPYHRLLFIYFLFLTAISSFFPLHFPLRLYTLSSTLCHHRSLLYPWHHPFVHQYHIFFITFLSITIFSLLYFPLHFPHGSPTPSSTPCHLHNLLSPSILSPFLFLSSTSPSLPFYIFLFTFHTGHQTPFSAHCRHHKLLSPSRHPFLPPSISSSLYFFPPHHYLFLYIISSPRPTPVTHTLLNSLPPLQPSKPQQDSDSPDVGLGS